MTPRPMLTGELVRLVPPDAAEFSQAFARWSMDSEYLRLADSNIATPITPARAKDEMLSEDLHPLIYPFAIRTLADDRLIGFVGLFEFDFASQEAWVGIGIGERADWGRGFGTDTMREILRYGFVELNLRRIMLDVFGYNPRGYRSYLRCGFKEEGRIKRYLHRGRQYWDLIYMGILRDEWDALQAA